MKKFTLLFLTLLLTIENLSAQNNMDQVKISVEKVADNIHVLFGSGGNIGLAVGDEYAYMIDDQFAALSNKILAAVNTLTDKPIKYLVNTHWHSDHTGGDSFTYFPASNVIHLGDNFPNGGYPFIDVNSNGDIEGLVRNLNHALFLVNDQTKIIPGHGKVSNRAELKAYRDRVDTIRGRVKMQKDSGKSLEEIQDMGVSKEWDDQFAKGFINANRLIEAIYTTVD